MKFIFVYLLAFLVVGTVTALASVALGLVLRLPWDTIFAMSIGCGIGTGIVNAFTVAQFYTRK